MTAFSASMLPIASAIFALIPAFEKARSAAINSEARVRGSAAAAGAATTIAAVSASENILWFMTVLIGQSI